MKKEQKKDVVQTRKEVLALHKRVLKEVRAMTPEEGFKSLVKSGIYTRDGNLAPEYGGPPRKKARKRQK